MARRTERERTERPERSYGQFCPIAAGLDVVGDRWVLLILRELSFGDRRFTDLRHNLAGIAPNLLSDRLRSLQERGLVTTAELPPPAARTVYRLTEDGLEVLPLLRAMARFGVRYLHGEPSAGFEADRAVRALLLPWRQRVAVELRVRVRFDDGDPLDVVLDGIDTTVGPAEGPASLTVESSVGELVAARRDGVPWAARISGPEDDRAAFLAAFALTAA